MPRSTQPIPADADQPEPLVVDDPVPDTPLEAAERARPVRILQYDTLRLLATVAVVLIHVTAAAIGGGAGDVAKAPLWQLRPNQLARWAVPAFALLTGALVWTRHIPLRPRPLAAFFRRRLLVVLVPYLVWSAIYFTLGRYLGIGPSTKLPPGLVPRLQIAFDLAVQGRVWFHLYFVPVVLTLYLAAPLLSPVARRLPGLLAAAVTASSVVLIDTVNLSVVGHANIKTLLLLFLGYAPYAAFGAWYAMRRQRWDTVLRYAWPLPLAAGAAMRLAEVDRIYTAPTPVTARLYVIAYMVLMVYGLLGAGVLIAPWLGRWSRSLADTSAWSYGVYLIHPLVILGLQRALEAAGLASLWQSPAFVYAVAVPAVTLASYTVSALLDRSKVTSWMA